MIRDSLLSNVAKDGHTRSLVSVTFGGAEARDFPGVSAPRSNEAE
jgi:hypothetical protein